MSRQFEFLEDSKASFSVAKNSVFKDEIRRNRLINGRLAIDGASFGESMLLFDDCSIANEGSRCDFIA